MALTKKELSQYYWLKREIEYMENRLCALRARAGSPRGMNFSEMSKSTGGVKDALAETAAEIVDLEAIIAAKQVASILTRKRIERFIFAIDDPMVRMVFTLRCIDGQSWKNVAAAMGHTMTEGNARQIFRRTLKTARERPD